MNKLSLFILIFISNFFYCKGQLLSEATKQSSVIKNGLVKYKMVVESENPQAKMMNNSTLEIAFCGSDTKANGLLMGGLLGAQITMDLLNGKGLALLTIMGQKKAVKMNNDDFKWAQNSTNSLSGEVNFTPVKGTQKVAGYACKKYLVKDPKNPDVQTTVFICESIKPDSGGLMDNILKTYKGFPLGFEVKSKDAKMSFMASEVSTKLLKKSDFKQEIPAEFELTTMENLMRDMGPMFKN
jgi:hypothetical protein